MDEPHPVDPRLEYQYNNMARRPDAPELLAGLAGRSSNYRERTDAALEHRYGDHARESIDIFPSGAPDAALLVYIHGGYWQRGDKSMYSYLAESWNAAGSDVAIVGYPLCPEVTMTRLLASIRNALAWLWRNASDLGVNASRINLCGHSAGGHLSAMALTTRWPEFAPDLPDDLIKSAITISGLYRLEPLLPTTISEALHLSPAEVADLSPVNLQPATLAPVLIVVGGNETAAFFDQADSLIDAWSGTSLSMERYDEPGADHFDVAVRLGDSGSELFRRVANWIR